MLAPGLAERLRGAAPDLVIHTCGPFQGQDYRVAEACIDAGVDYIDLADGREFVAGIEALSERASTSGVVTVSGASSVPGPSSAAVDEPLRGSVDCIPFVTASPPATAPSGARRRLGPSWSTRAGLFGAGRRDGGGSSTVGRVCTAIAIRSRSAGDGGRAATSRIWSCSRAAMGVCGR